MNIECRCPPRNDGRAARLLQTPVHPRLSPPAGTSKNLITVSWRLGLGRHDKKWTKHGPRKVSGLICRININDLCQRDFNILTR